MTGQFECRHGEAGFELPQDDGGIAKNVGADLKDGCPAIAPRQRHQVWPRHDDWNFDPAIGEILQAQREADFLCIG